MVTNQDPFFHGYHLYSFLYKETYQYQVSPKTKKTSTDPTSSKAMILHHLSAVLDPGVSTVKADLQCLKLIHPENCLEHVDVSKVSPYI